MDLQGKKILVTGSTGQVGLPVTKALAKNNEVWAAARFSKAALRADLEAAGVHCVTVDLAAGELTALPEDFNYVLDFAVSKTNDWDADMRGNAEGLGLLMAHCRAADAFLHCSTTGVYEADGHHAFAETDPLGDNHRVMSFMSTYSITKIAAEAVARFAARQWNLPTTIARLNVPYGDNGGWPAIHLDMMIGGMAVGVHPDAPSVYNPIHEDDIIASIPKLLDAASVPATIVNWGGDDAVSVEDWCAYLGELTGVKAETVLAADSLESVTIDLTKQHELLGRSSVNWKDGFRRMVAARHPELLKS